MELGNSSTKPHLLTKKTFQMPKSGILKYPYGWRLVIADYKRPFGGALIT